MKDFSQLEKVLLARDERKSDIFYDRACFARKPEYHVKSYIIFLDTVCDRVCFGRIHLETSPSPVKSYIKFVFILYDGIYFGKTSLSSLNGNVESMPS